MSLPRIAGLLQLTFFPLYWPIVRQGDGRRLVCHGLPVLRGESFHLLPHRRNVLGRGPRRRLFLLIGQPLVGGDIALPPWDLGSEVHSAPLGTSFPRLTLAG